ncbi:TonB-dependent receptor [Tenacibaculum mesophilum]|uniref:TonB-dependent receptor domain-containing protein n=1 Tax=Tenacibaculum mesophilum TaxID=104268 RepID=UPI0014317293|nr:TonB-dependent receptor [Tenacibaculum mesophilum]KAF9657983.1 TonB-dependent receptor [Tenacibaculum mesophilum]
MKSKLKACSIIFTLFLAVQTVVAQYTISGKIIDEKGNPINNVEVFDASGGKLAISDAQGNYKTQPLQSGNYSLVFFSYNFEIKEHALTITNKNIVENITLLKLDEELSEVIINQRLRKVFSLKRLKAVEGTAIYEGKKTEVVLLDQTVGNKAANNARQIYSQVVGLNIYENDDAGLQLNIGGRGLDPNRTSNFNTRQNGYDISADVLGYPESYYTPPAEALQEIQIVRGAASLQYGTQFGGLLNFKFNEPNKSKEFEFITRQSTGSFGLFNSFNSVGGTVDKTGYYGYINYKRGDGFRPNSEFNSINIYGHVNHKLSEKTTLTVEATYLNYLAKQAGGLNDKMFNEDPFQSNRSRNWFRVNWNLWTVKLDHNFTEDTRLSVNLFGLNASRKAIGFRGNYKSSNVSPITYVDEPFADGNYATRDLINGQYKNWGTEIRFLSNYDFRGQKNTYLLGVKYYKANNSEQQGAGSNGVDANFTFADVDAYASSNFKFPNTNVALFGEHIFKLSDKFSITPGFRLEYIKTGSNGDYKTVLWNNEDLQNGVPLPNGINTFRDDRTKERSFALFGIGASYKPSTKLEVYANASQNYRSVTFNDIRTVSPTFKVDENIDDEEGGTADIGIRGKIKNIVTYDLSGFGLFYNKRIGIFWVSSGPDAGDRLRTNVGDAFIYGFEGFTDVSLANVFKLPSNYVLNTYVNLALTQSEYTDSLEKSVIGNQVEFIPNLNLKTGVKFGYKNFLSSLQLTHLSEQQTDATHATVDSTHPSYGTIGPIPAYTIVDASFSYSYKKWKLETGVNNLLDEKYFTRRATGYPGPGIIPSAPRNWYVTLQFKI